MASRLFAPVTMITLAAIIAAGFAALSILVALNTPWLGVRFDRSYTGQGVRVAEILDNSPVAGQLHAGDILTALESSGQERALSPLTTMEEPDQLNSYAQYNAFFAQQAAVWSVLVSPSFIAIARDLRRIEITPENSRPLTALPASFWWLLFFGGASFLLGVSAWSMRTGDAVTRILAVSGLGFMAGAYSCAIYVTREFALSGGLFYGLATLNHLGIMVFAYAAILFFWHYPGTLGRGPAARICAAGVAALWLNETLQWLTWPAHVFYAHFVVAYCILVLFAGLQWRKSRSAPLQRAMLKWLLTVMLLCLGLTLFLFYLPVIVTGRPIASTVSTFFAVFMFYLGLVTGNIRFHQFDMELWWIRAWQWLLLLFVALTADALFMYFLKMSDTVSFGLAVVAGGTYLLTRQWCWGFFSGKQSGALDRALPHLVESLVLPAQNSTSGMQWQQLVMRVFNPISVTVNPDPCEFVSIEQNGIVLRLPDLTGRAGITLFCCEKGGRLFAVNDVYLARRLLELMRHSTDLFAAHEQGAMDERRRIQRDLHDDVAARLLSLLHQTREPEISKVAQNALRGLRDVIHRLDDEATLLMDVMSDIEAGVREQLAGLPLVWISPDQWPDIMLSSSQHINLRRIVREAIANAVRHAQPENIIIELAIEKSRLSLNISHNGTISDPAGWVSNRGLNNIKSRVAEMHGAHKWQIEQRGAAGQYCKLAVNVPLSISEHREHSVN